METEATRTCQASNVCADPDRDNFKCGPPHSSDRVFDLRGVRASKNACKSMCEDENSCVAMSGKFGSWCIGCLVPLYESQNGGGGAIAFSKAACEA